MGRLDLVRDPKFWAPSGFRPVRPVVVPLGLDAVVH